MDADDFQLLYGELRGSRCSMAIMDAKSHFLEREMQKSLVKLTEAHETYRESRMRILRQDPEKQVDAKAKDRDRQVRRLKRKQEKAKEILEKFEEILPELKKLADRERAKREAKAEAEANQKAQDKSQRTESQQSESQQSESQQSESQQSEMPAKSDDAARQATQSSGTTRRVAYPEGFLEAFAATTGERQLELVSERFSFRPLETEADVDLEGVYLMHDAGHGHLFEIRSDPEDQQQLNCVDPQTDEMIGSVSRKSLVAYSQERKLVLLTTKTKTSKNVSPEGDFVDADRDKVLDMGAFSQLMDSAQRSGLVPGADQIAHVRDKEYRMGQFEMALQTIENMYGQFTAASAARTQKLLREDTDIAAGRVKMSPKDLQAKRARDRAQDQAVERARMRFCRVLDGLRILVKQD